MLTKRRGELFLENTRINDVLVQNVLSHNCFILRGDRPTVQFVDLVRNHSRGVIIEVSLAFSLCTSRFHRQDIETKCQSQSCQSPRLELYVRR